MSDESTVRVHFGRPTPLFPLDTVVLMPHGVVPLHIFEPRYRQLVRDVLDGSGQIALGVFEGDQWKREYHGRPAVRPVVCLGQIIQHEQLPDGRYNVVLRGVCRARIVRELPPVDDQLYREVILEPVGPTEEDEPALAGVRERVRSMLSEAPLTDLRDAAPIVHHLEDPAVPTSAILELLAFTLVSDGEVRYRLLAESDAGERGAAVVRELESLASLLRAAEPQRAEEAPKGCSWN